MAILNEINKKSNKKAQITIFFIIGLVIVIISIIIFAKINTKKPEIKKNISIETPELIIAKEKIKNCLEKSAKESIEKTGNQGYLKPKNYIASKNTRIAYFYFKGERFFPSIKDFENSLSEYISDNTRKCFNESFYLIEKEKSKIKTTFSDDNIYIEMSYDASFYYEGKKIDFPQININIKSNLLPIIKTAKNIVDNINDDEWLNIDSETEKYKINIIKIDTKTWIYEIIDEQGLENDQFKYRFAVKYS